MTDFVAGSPLHKLVWVPSINKVKIKFRPGVSPEIQHKFIEDLANSARELHDQNLGSANGNP